MPTGLLLAGATGVSMFGQVMQGIQANQQSQMAARVYKEQAAQERVKANAEISAQDTQAIDVLGKTRASAASGGISMAGSPTIVNRENASRAILRDAYSRYSGNYASNQDLYAAANARWQGKQALYGGFLGAGTTALTSAFLYKGMNAQTTGSSGSSSSSPWSIF